MSELSTARRFDRVTASAFALGLLCAVLPLTAKYLPFTDLSGHMALVGALAHRHEAASQIDRYFIVDPRLCPSHLYEGFVWLASQVLSINAASNLYLALFCVLALPASAYLLLGALKRDVRLAVFALPLVYHRAMWFGFVNYCAALPLVFASLAVLVRELEREDGPSRRGLLLLSGLYFLTSFAHFFGALWCMGLSLALVALRRPALRTAGAIGLTMAPTVLFVARWMSEKGSHEATGSAQGLVALLREDVMAIPPLSFSLPEFARWSTGGLAGLVDEAVLLVATLSLLALGGFALATRRRGPRDARLEALAPGVPARWRHRHLLLLGAVIAAYFALPMALPHPNWWAVSVRFVVPTWLFAVAAIPASGRRYPPALLVPVALAGAFYAAHFALDTHRWFNGVEMAGLDAALDEIPPGQRVLALWPPFDHERHYDHFPLGHAGGYYTVRRGGYANPWFEGAPHDLWVTTRARPAAPGWGRAHDFVWALHSASFDYFLVKSPAPGQPEGRPLFLDAAPGSVRSVAVHGLWHVYERTR